MEEPETSVKNRSPMQS
jgi:hypothetical protein